MISLNAIFKLFYVATFGYLGQYFTGSLESFKVTLKGLNMLVLLMRCNLT